MSQRILVVKLTRPELYTISSFISEMSVKAKRRARIRGQIVWFSHQNKTPEYIAQYLNCSVFTVYKWLNIYREKGIAGLSGKSRKIKITEKMLDEIMSLSHWKDSILNDKEYRQRWSFRKISKWIKDTWHISISHEQVRKIIQQKLKG